MNIKPAIEFSLMIAARTEMQSVFAASADQITRLTRAADVAIDGTVQMPKAAARAVLSGGAEVAVPLEGIGRFCAGARATVERERKAAKKRLRSSPLSWAILIL